ncbi:MAG: hypothetical protein WC998_05905 [Candidatus Paceibacterota bacterium]|jgi:hypothetical protein
MLSDFDEMEFQRDGDGVRAGDALGYIASGATSLPDVLSHCTEQFGMMGTDARLAVARLQARALSPDARTVLMALATGPQQFRPLGNVAIACGLTVARTKAACRELGMLVCSEHIRQIPEPGVIVHEEATALLARAVRETPEPGRRLMQRKPASQRRGTYCSERTTRHDEHIGAREADCGWIAGPAAAFGRATV